MNVVKTPGKVYHFPPQRRRPACLWRACSSDGEMRRHRILIRGPKRAGSGQTPCRGRTRSCNLPKRRFSRSKMRKTKPNSPFWQDVAENGEDHFSVFGVSIWVRFNLDVQHVAVLCPRSPCTNVDLKRSLVRLLSSSLRLHMMV